MTLLLLWHKLANWCRLYENERQKNLVAMHIKQMYCCPINATTGSVPSSFSNKERVPFGTVTDTLQGRPGIIVLRSLKYTDVISQRSN